MVSFIIATASLALDFIVEFAKKSAVTFGLATVLVVVIIIFALVYLWKETVQNCYCVQTNQDYSTVRQQQERTSDLVDRYMNQREALSYRNEYTSMTNF